MLYLADGFFGLTLVTDQEALASMVRAGDHASVDDAFPTLRRAVKLAVQGLAFKRVPSSTIVYLSGFVRAYPSASYVSSGSAAFEAFPVGVEVTHVPS